MDGVVACRPRTGAWPVPCLHRTRVQGPGRCRKTKAGWTVGPAHSPRFHKTVKMLVVAASAVRVAAPLIVTALAACDNVDWGGATVQVVTPPPPGPGEANVPEPGTVAGLGLPTGR